jgi:hypothetical protein
VTTDGVTRRAAVKFSAAVTIAAGSWRPFPAGAGPLEVRGYGRDPILLQRAVPWSRTLTTSQLLALATLCDIVLPAEPPYPSAAAIGVHDFLDEWVSAPYPEMRKDRNLLLRGLTALDQVTEKTYRRSFAAASQLQQTNMFEKFCSADGREREFARRLIQLICGGYYTAREGFAAIGYVGNVSLSSFPGPPAEVVRYLREELVKL